MDNQGITKSRSTNRLRDEEQTLLNFIARFMYIRLKIDILYLYIVFGNRTNTKSVFEE